MCKWLKRIFKPWPRRYCIEVYSGDCELLGYKYVTINSYNEIMPLGSDFCQEIMQEKSTDDEVYWNYREVR